MGNPSIVGTDNYIVARQKSSSSGMSPEAREAFTAYLEKEIAPQALEIDFNPKTLKLALQGIGDRSLLALKVPQHLGGAGWSEIDYRRWQILMAKYSGALTFLQTQHQSAASQLAKSENQTLQQEYLLQMGTGKKLVGVGFSHLRRRGRPMVQGEMVAEGYRLNGTVPWITGWNFFDSFILGATLPDGRELYGMLPLQNTEQTSGGTISLSKPMQLIAVTATNTVSAKLDNWILKRDRLVTIKPAGAIHKSSRQNILHHGFYALGCAYGSLDILQKTGEKKQLAFIEESWQVLQQEVDRCQDRAIASLSDNDITYEQLQIRARAINLAGRCSQAAVIASSGAANDLHSHAGRVYREALLFSVSGQTTDVMAASLKRLIDN